MSSGVKEAIKLMATDLPMDKIMGVMSMHQGGGGHR